MCIAVSADNKQGIAAAISDGQALVEALPEYRTAFRKLCG
jgi:hypothetical protein